MTFENHVHIKYLKMRGRYVGCDLETAHSPSGWSSDERMMNNVQMQLINLPHH